MAFAFLLLLVLNGFLGYLHIRWTDDIIKELDLKNPNRAYVILTSFAVVAYITITLALGNFMEIGVFANPDDIYTNDEFGTGTVLILSLSILNFCSVLFFLSFFQSDESTIRKRLKSAMWIILILMVIVFVIAISWKWLFMLFFAPAILMAVKIMK